MAEILDRDLDALELKDLQRRLEGIVETAQEDNLVRLAKGLLFFLQSEEFHLVEDTPDLFERVLRWLSALETKWLVRSRLKAILVGSLIGLGVFAVFNLGELLLGLRSADQLELTLAKYTIEGHSITQRGVIWFTVRVILEGLTGILLLISAGLLLFRREILAVRMSYFSLLISLAVVNLLVFYFEQFSSIVIASIQFLVLIGVMRYRRRFLVKEPPRL
jgi:hypothetical protein